MWADNSAAGAIDIRYVHFCEMFVLNKDVEITISSFRFIFESA